MNQIKLFIELTRLKKPIGYMLLFWPCAWGLTIAYDFSNQNITTINSNMQCISFLNLDLSVNEIFKDTAMLKTTRDTSK